MPGNTEVWDPTYTSYYQLGDLLTVVAQSHSHVPIDETTTVRWREVLGLMREVDTKADDPAADHNAIITELTTFDRFSERYPHLTPDVLGPEGHAKLVDRAATIFRLGKYISNAETPFRYIALRTSEAIQTAELFADCASEQVLGNPNFGRSFMPILRSLGIAACMLDSAHDINEDYDSGKAIIERRTALKLRALGWGMMHLGPPLSVCFRPPVIRQLWQAAKIHGARHMHR